MNPPEYYLHMREHLPEQWAFIRCWIQSCRLSSLLEVGGGDGYAATFLPPGAPYLNVDPSALNPDSILAQWQEVLKAEHAGRWDGFLSMATFDTAGNPEPLLEGVAEIRPRVACITFCLGLSDSDENEPRAGTAFCIVSKPWLARWAQAHNFGAAFASVAEHGVMLLMRQ